MINNKIFNNLHKVYEGSEKILFDGPDRMTLIQRFKDEALLNGKAVSVKGRGIFNNRMSQHFMSQIAFMGIKTHFVRHYSVRDQLIKSLEMFPFRIKVLNAPSNEMVKNFSISSDGAFVNPIVEFKFKNSSGSSVLINRDHVLSFNWASKDDLDNIEALVLRMNDFLQGYFLSMQLRLIGVNFEFGKIYDFDTYEIILGDGLTLDSFELIDISNASQKIDFSKAYDNPDNLLNTYKSLMERMRIMDFANLVKR